MLIEVGASSHVTIPNEVIKNLGMREGDKFELIERDGGIFLCPVAVYPQKKLEHIAKLIKEAEEKPSKIYDTVDEMFADMGINIGDSDV
jgi:AbrB family looped-hinge helix DNA binding protein